MLTFVIWFLGFVAVGAFFAKTFAWQRAWWGTMFHDELEPEPIYARMKHRVFTPLWLASTLVGALVTAGAALLQNEGLKLYLMMGAIALVASLSVWRAAKLFNEAVAELGWKLPPTEN
jgi:hypothetical protein